MSYLSRLAARVAAAALALGLSATALEAQATMDTARTPARHPKVKTDTKATNRALSRPGVSRNDSTAKPSDPGDITRGGDSLNRDSAQTAMPAHSRKRAGVDSRPLNDTTSNGSSAKPPQ